jgi:RHS repeat-associated protein
MREVQEKLGVGKKRNGALERAWLYRDGLNPVAELDGTGALISRFVCASRPNVPEYMVRGGTTYRILSDHLGSPRVIVDVASGAAVWRADYDAWGNRTVTLGAEDFVPFGFAGGIHDVDTRLVRFGARDYDAVTGRWTAKDPIGFAGGGANLYAYAQLDPVNATDREGKKATISDYLLCYACTAVTSSATASCFAAATTAAPGTAGTGYGACAALGLAMRGPCLAVCKPILDDLIDALKEPEKRYCEP